MNTLNTKIIQEIEAYLTEANLRNDQILVNCARENHGWIRLELLSRYKTLSSYSYDKILHALQNTQSNEIELSTFEPRCIRRRYQIFGNNNTRTVIIHGLPHDVRLCTKSTTCATEQILFCQNSPTNPSKSIKQSIVHNKFSYDFYKPDHLLKQIHKCIIISVLNPHCFTIQLSQDAFEFDRFQRQINTFYNTINDKQYNITLEQIQINLCVICCDTKSTNENRIWNRSQILDFDPSDNTVNLFHVDLGTWEEYVPINRLRHITQHFHQYQVFSLTCRLAQILPRNNEHDQLIWTNEATQQFLSVIDEAVPEIEFVSIARNDEHQIKDHDLSIHPVVALYNRLGEILQLSLTESCTTSTNSSVISSSSTSSRLNIKLIHVNTFNRREYSNQSHKLPIIFVRYKDTILMPDFNICTLLKTINSKIDISAIENYATATKSNCVHITLESDFDIFSQLNSLNNIEHSNNIALYPMDFVNYILRQYHFQKANVFLALENAQSHVSDLTRWFATDNELNISSTPISNDSVRFDQLNDQRVSLSPVSQRPSNLIRLPFSNRLINPM
ncbi:hypothetical protein I4U23_000996 [Adineta vaga]|nr:hypothetical protein I4U23_000996 [Adineta vaga]